MRHATRLVGQSVTLGCGLCLLWGAWAVAVDGDVSTRLAAGLGALAVLGLVALYLARPLED